MNITLRIRHLAYVADIIRGWPTDENSDLWQQIKEKVNSYEDIEHFVTVQTTAKKVVQIFDTTSLKPEGMVNVINAEMLEILMPQITQLVQIGDEDGIYVATQIQMIRARNKAELQQKIDNVISIMKK